MVIGITGGIGSGKSTICIALETIGYKVYYCDKRASYLMNNNSDIKEQLMQMFTDDIYKDGKIDKSLLSSIIFNNQDIRQTINSIVHPIVTADMEFFINSNRRDKAIFIESAIMFESGIDTLMDKIITISAPLAIRISRVEKRDKTNKQSIQNRITAQISDTEREVKSDAVIVSDDRNCTLLQLLTIIDNI